ncbi:MAG: SigE family RNA polymerase sigma factor [Nocardioides sp.]|uniref:SigE family RNA polymerase sigma factor n=1 Tax=Nocardioides sp. TaxID=35761 RepID=UPI0039E70ADC
MTRAAILETPVTRRARGWDADEALEQLYAAHWRSLVRLAVLLLHDQAAAEEVVQDSFIAVHGRWGQLRDPDRALAYLRQTVVNRARSALRRRTVADRYLTAQRQVVASEQAGTHLPDDHARRDLVLSALRELPDRQREVIALRYYLDLSEAQIADTLGISCGAVKSHASRGVAALREQLAEVWEEQP